MLAECEALLTDAQKKLLEARRGQSTRARAAFDGLRPAPAAPELKGAA